MSSKNTLCTQLPMPGLTENYIHLLNNCENLKF